MKSRILAAIIGFILILPITLHAEQWSSPSYISELNSSARDLEPWISADGKTLYFSSDRFPGGPCGKCGLELFVSHLVDGVWSAPERLPEPLNDPLGRDGHPSLTLDGRYMYFHSNRPSDYNSGKRTSDTDADIWMSENINGQWQQPVNLGPNINTTSSDYAPQISVDGQTLLFSSKRPGGYGNYDLYISRKVDGVWQQAENMGPVINSSKAQVHPSVSYTGKYFFFSDLSNIYRSVKVDGAWQAPVKLPSTVNHCWSGTESSIFNDCTDTLYFYNMCSPAGSWDIATTQWLDIPDDNPCSQLIIPEGQWRVRVTLLEASAGLMSDIYIDEPISQLLIRKSLKNVGTVVSTPFLSADELVFHIHVHGGDLGEYDHYSDSEFARVERTDPLRYVIGFEDLPAELADWDYNDTVLLVELVGVEVNIWETENYLGEAQVVEQAPMEQDTLIGVPLTRGVGLDAVAMIPGAGLDESGYGIITEGDPSLYGELLTDAPFDSTGDFVKVELTSGQQELADGNAIRLSLDLVSQVTAQDQGGQAQPRLYQFDIESSSWREVALQSMVSDEQLVADTPSVGLFALGIPKPAPPEIPEAPGDQDGQDDSVPGARGNPFSGGPNARLSCGQIPGPAGLGSLIAWIGLIVPLLGAGVYRLIRKAG
ncbi:MAG TPA: hypothetical protein VM658_15670 [bacterium]|nr:hypothetical protein [bacterium]